MRLFSTVFLAFALPLTFLATLSAHTPIKPPPVKPAHVIAEPLPEKPVYVKQLTAEEDAELNKWITDFMLKTEEAQKETFTLKADLLKADTNIISLQIDLVSAKNELIGSQREVFQLTKAITDLRQWGIEQQARADAAEKERDEARKERDKAKALAERFAWIIGIEAFALTLLVCLWLRVPTMGWPGIMATCALPVLALGIIKLLPHL